MNLTDYLGDDKTVVMHISKLRRKIETDPKQLETVVLFQPFVTIASLELSFAAYPVALIPFTTKRVMIVEKRMLLILFIDLPLGISFRFLHLTLL